LVDVLSVLPSRLERLFQLRQSDEGDRERSKREFGGAINDSFLKISGNSAICG
jgi:hypothetical protein